MLENVHVKLPFIDWIWRVKGSLPLEPQQSRAETFGRLEPLFQSRGTNYSIDGDTLTYSNKNPAPQDKLATFVRGTLQVVGAPGGNRLRYDLKSPALLACFLAPLLFLAFGQITLAVGTYETAAEEAAKKSGKDKKDEKEPEEADVPMNPVDKFLGAPEPETKEEREKKKKEEEAKNKGKSKRSPTSAYVFAGLFATLYLVGRFLEPWLIRRAFRRRLSGEDEADENLESAGAQRPG